MRWLGLLQAVLLIAAFGFGVPALIDWQVFNGMDLLALLLFLAFGVAVSAEERLRP